MNWDLVFTIIGVGVALSIVFSMLGVVYTVIVTLKFESVMKTIAKYNTTTTSPDDVFQQLIEFNKEK